MSHAAYRPLIASTQDSLKSVKLTAVVFVITISRFIFGFDRGLLGGASLGLTNAKILTQSKYAEVVSLPMLVAAPMCIIVGWILKRFGRKKTLIMSSILYVVGSAVIVAFERPSISVFVVGRTLCNISFAMGHVTALVYLVEICPENWRGKVMMVNQMMLPLGNTLAGLVNISISKMMNCDNWRLMLGITLVPAVLQFFCALCIPESYKWLFSVQKHNAARIAANNFYTDINEEQFLELCDQKPDNTSTKLPKGPLRRMFSLTVILMIIPQLAGFSAVMYYSVQIAQLAGISSNTNTFIVSELIFVTNFIGTMIAIPLIERLGRRTLLLTSIIGTLLSIILIVVAINLMDSISLNVNPAHVVEAHCLVSKCSDCIGRSQCGYCMSTNSSVQSYCMSGMVGHSFMDRCEIEGSQWMYSHCDSNNNWFILVAILLFVVYFSIGLAPIPFLVSSELFPQSYRDKVMGFTLSVFYAGTAIVALGFGELQNVLGVKNLFLVFGVCTLFGLAFIYLYLPETKGKRTEEMYQLFFNPWCGTGEDAVSDQPYESIQ